MCRFYLKNHTPWTRACCHGPQAVDTEDADLLWQEWTELSQQEFGGRFTVDRTHTGRGLTAQHRVRHQRHTSAYYHSVLCSGLCWQLLQVPVAGSAAVLLSVQRYRTMSLPA